MIYKRRDGSGRLCGLGATALALAQLCVVGCQMAGNRSPLPGALGQGSPTALERAAVRPEQPGIADPELHESAELHDYLAYAALNNAGLEAAFNRWKAAVERIAQVRSLPDPTFTYRYFIREVETRVGPMERGAGLSQSFPWFGKLELRADAATEAARAQRQQYEAIKLALFYDVKDAYYEYYFLGRAIEVVQENLDLIEYLESVARARYKTASASHPDVMRAQVELGKLEDRLKALRAFRGPIVARLNAALNRPTQDELPFPESIEAEQLDGDDAAVLTLMTENNPDLRALSHRVEQAGAQIELARKDYYPNFTLGVEYTDIGQPPGDRAGDAGDDAWMASLSMNIPIWRDKYAAGDREARARKLAAMGDRRQRESDLAARVQRVLYEYRDSERKISLYGDTLIPKAKESIESTETAFRAGKATFLELVDAERSLLEFELSYERSLANRGSRLAELESLVGIALPRVADN